MINTHIYKLRMLQHCVCIIRGGWEEDSVENLKIWLQNCGVGSGFGRFFNYKVRVTLAKIWMKMEVPLHFRCYKWWCWDLTELPQQGGGLSPCCFRDIGHHGDDDGDISVFACCVYVRWDARACTKGGSEHVRVFLSIPPSPLRSVLMRRIHVIRTNPCNKGLFQRWHWIERLRSWAGDGRQKVSEAIGTVWVSKVGVENKDTFLDFP